MAGTFGGRKLIEPGSALEVCRRHRLPMDAWLGRANTYHCPSGIEAGRAWLLMHRIELDALDRKAGHELFLASEDSEIRVPGLTILQARRVVPGPDRAAGDGYLIEAADRRWKLRGIPIDQGFNVRKDPVDDPALPWRDDTLDSGNRWSWSGMIEEIWKLLPDLGPWPGLPYEPHGLPEGFAFWGSTAVEALDYCLLRLNCELVYNPLTDSFSITNVGVLDEVWLTAEALRRPLRIEDEAVDSAARGYRPETVRVLFRKADKPLEESPYHAIDLPDQNGTPEGVISGSTVTLFDDLLAEPPENPDDPDAAPANVSDLQDRAEERVSQYFLRIDARQRRYRGVWVGILDDPGLLPGSQLTDTRWGDRGQGLLTEAVRAEQPDRLAGWRPGGPTGLAEEVPAEAGSTAGSGARLIFPFWRSYGIYGALGLYTQFSDPEALNTARPVNLVRWVQSLDEDAPESQGYVLSDYYLDTPTNYYRTAVYDRGGYYSERDNSKLVAPVAGLYHIQVRLQFPRWFGEFTSLPGAPAPEGINQHDPFTWFVAIVSGEVLRYSSTVLDAHVLAMGLDKPDLDLTTPRRQTLILEASTVCWLPAGREIRCYIGSDDGVAMSGGSLYEAEGHFSMTLQTAGIAARTTSTGSTSGAITSLVMPEPFQVATANGVATVTWRSHSQGAIPIGNGTDLTLNRITEGDNITVTNGPGTIRLSSTGGTGAGGLATQIKYGVD